MSTLLKAGIAILGIFLRILSYFTIKNKNKWVVGSNDGEKYSDNSKYFFLFLLNQDGQNPIWITRNSKVVKEVRAYGGQCYTNFSLVGIYHILTAKHYVFSTVRNDVYFFFHTKSRIIINLWHGMPIKKIIYDNKNFLNTRNTNYKIWEHAVVGFQHKNVDIICATSSYYQNILSSAFRSKNVYITGQPRNDLFKHADSKFLREKYSFNNSYVITYMPTHRGYGKGLINPFIFKDHFKAQKYFKENNILLIVKFHTNMKLQFGNYNDISNHEVFRDVSDQSIDPQELLHITDCLITDYSSCFIDFLLLNRPIILYHYDDYQNEDNELYYDLNDLNPGIITRSEDQLFGAIQRYFADGNVNADERKKLNELFNNNFFDGKNSFRVFKQVYELNKLNE